MKQVKELAEQEGALVKHTSPYTPEYNGTVERCIGVLKDMSRTMMQRANFSKSMRDSLWTEAV